MKRHDKPVITRLGAVLGTKTKEQLGTKTKEQLGTKTKEQLTASQQEFMERAIALAKRAGEAGEVPIGALVVCDGEIVAEAANARETSGIATHHAEVMAIEMACKKLGRWRLNDCDLYVTLEPCTMCAGAIVLARIREVVFGAMDPKAGAAGSLFNVLSDSRLNHRPIVTSGVLAAECGQMLSEFFKSRRSK